MRNNIFRFNALVAEQSSNHQVMMIRASASEIQQIAVIDRLGRTSDGLTTGFQRPQVSGHIAEIRNYLESSDSVLPNALVVAFVDGAKLIRTSSGDVLEVDVTSNKPGLIVDGQQRLTALLLSGREDFQVFVSCLICKDLDELRRQFILINNTRPLPKSLIYELLPSVENLPERLSTRSLAASITERLNFDPKSSLHGIVKMQTNPTGVLKDTTLQKAIINSEAAGAIQVLMQKNKNIDTAVDMFSNFFYAVQDTFRSDWDNHKPTSSRLVHGVGIVAMGYVMDEIYSRTRSIEIDSFKEGIKPLIGKTAWTEGHWHFSDDDLIPWNRVEFTTRQCHQLAEHLVSIVRREATYSRQKRKVKVE